MFVKGDYIVNLLNSTSFSNGFVYKQRENFYYLKAELDNSGSPSNGLSVCDYNTACTWRYATKEEIKAYNEAGKPIDIRTIKSEKEKKTYETINKRNFRKNI